MSDAEKRLRKKDSQGERTSTPTSQTSTVSRAAAKGTCDNDKAITTSQGNEPQTAIRTATAATTTRATEWAPLPEPTKEGNSTTTNRRRVVLAVAQRNRHNEPAARNNALAGAEAQRRLDVVRLRRRHRKTDDDLWKETNYP